MPVVELWWTFRLCFILESYFHSFQKYLPNFLIFFPFSDLEAGRKTIESRIRKHVKRITRCDVFTDNILLGEDTDSKTSPPFDVVMSCLCLECCPTDVKGYAGIMKRINKLLGPGGGLVLCGFLQGKKWKAGSSAITYSHISIDQKELHDAVAGAGFGKIEIKTMSKEGLKDNFFMYGGLYCLAAEKL